jgi:hypothetical protein
MIKSFFAKFFEPRYAKISDMILDDVYDRNGWAIDDLLSGYPFGYDDEVANHTRERIDKMMITYGGMQLNSPEAKADLLALAKELQSKGR